MKFAVPIRARQPDFKLDLRIARRLYHAGQAAKGWQFFVRRCGTRRRRERSRRDGLRRRDRRVLQFQIGQSFAGGCRGRAERQRGKRQSGQPLPIEFASCRYSHFFISAVQFRTTLMGAGADNRVITRNWPPSPVTTKRFLPESVSGVSKRSFGAPASNAPEPVLTSAAIIFLPASVKNNSFPFLRHCGSSPPSTETCHLPLSCGKVAT